MANQIKGLWLIVLLVAAGTIIFFLGFGQSKKPVQEGVVLQEIFNQKAPESVKSNDSATNEVVSAPVVVSKAGPKEADPIPSMAIITSPENGHEAGFAIQVYSFQDKDRVEAALASLRNSGYQAFLIVSDLGEKGVWYRIRVGGIPHEAAAKKLLEQIRKNYNSGFIVKPAK